MNEQNKGDAKEHARRTWLCVLSCSPADVLEQIAAPGLKDYACEWLRQPEQGLAPVRTRIGNTGDRFNVGEATIVRCALRVRGPSGALLAGVGYVLGRNERHAERVAQLDALLQDASLRPLLWHSIIEPLRARLAERHRHEREQAQASRVRFFTMQPETA